MSGAQETREMLATRLADEGAGIVREGVELIQAGRESDARELLVVGMVSNPALEAYIEERMTIAPRAFRRRLKADVRRAKREAKQAAATAAKRTLK